MMGLEPIFPHFEGAFFRIKLHHLSHQEASNGSMPLHTCLFALTKLVPVEGFEPPNYLCIETVPL